MTSDENASVSKQPKAQDEWRERLERMNREHESRIREDPAYREECERKERERAEAESRSAERRRCREKNDRNWRRMEKGIPPRLWPLIETPTATDARQHVDDFVAVGNGSTFLVLAGSRGVGKTVAAAAAVDQSEDGLFVKATELVRSKLGQGRWKWEQVHDSGLLVIDDLFAEYHDAKGFADSALVELIDYRYDWQKKLIGTTNLTGEALLSVFDRIDGGRTSDRLREAGEIFEIPGESLRERGNPAPIQRLPRNPSESQRVIRLDKFTGKLIYAGDLE